MLFNSLSFLLFFPAVLAGFAALPQRFRWPWLLAASYLFYMAWEPAYALLILLSTAVDYGVARAMVARPDRRARRPWLALSLAVNLGLLFTFKYLDFATASLQAALESIGFAFNAPSLDLLLPVGISFYTFQTLAYSIDVYRGKIEPERHPGLFALYVAFWPQLVAGPIERPQNLLPQLHRLDLPSAERVRSGLLLMLQGYVEKLVIADRLAFYVEPVYADAQAAGGAAAYLATIAFAFQIYCDFSGYSHIAIGCSRVLGVELMANFRRPYFATSISDFWGRWHISLSTWFRDYVYIPLGGNRVGPKRHAANLLITFVVSGLWHGAAWTFVVWGALHGFFLVSARWTDDLQGRLGALVPPAVRTTVARLVVFHLALLGWVFFRAESVGDAVSLVAAVFRDPASLTGLTLPFGPADALVAVVAVVALLVVEAVAGDPPASERLEAASRPVRWAATATATVVLLWFGVFTSRAFVYFQF